MPISKRRTVLDESFRRGDIVSSIDSSITGLIAAQQASLSSNISITVAAKQLDAYKQQGDAVVSLLEGAVQLSKEVGKGGRIDAIA
jgi:hypothetical protein